MIGRSVSLRTRLTRTLVALGLVSVLLLAAVNFVVVRDLLDRTSESQVVTLRELRADGVEIGVERLLDRVASAASDPGMSEALIALDEGYQSVDTTLSDDERDRLLANVGALLDVLDEADVDAPAAESLIPVSVQGQRIQLEYGANNVESDRSELIDAGDGSPYSAAHVEYHDYLRSVADNLGASDLLLVSTQSHEIVYSVDKAIDLGTDVVDGPFSDDGPGAVWDRLGGSGVSDPVIVDAAAYLPDLSAPLVHLGATVRDDAEVVGAVVVSIPIDALTAIVSAQQQWELLGLGDTGDAYVVGADGRLRSIPRSWSRDPDAYLERFVEVGGDPRIRDLMEFTGSPVLLHEIDNDAIASGGDDEGYVGTVNNGLDRRALTASTPLELPGLEWFIVAEQQTSETGEELERFVWSTLVLLLVLLPILAIIGVLLGRVFARPVRPLVAGASEIASGRFDTRVDDLGSNELGDLARQLNAMADQLRDDQAAIAAEDDRIATMLSSVLPSDLAERVRAGDRGVAEVVDTATVVAISVTGLPEPTGAEHDAVIELTGRLTGVVDEARERFGLERIRAASEQQLFVAGRGRPGQDAGSAVSFAQDAVERIVAVGPEFGVTLRARAGLACGLVASGVLGSQQLSFGVWGDPVALAIDLAERRPDTGVFIDGSVSDVLDAAVSIVPVDGEPATFRVSGLEPSSGPLS